VSATGGRSEARSTCARRDDQARSGLRWLVRPGEQQSCPTKRLTHRVMRADPRPHDVRGRKVPSPSPRPARTSKPPAPGATQLTSELTSRNTRVAADAAFPIIDTCWPPTRNPVNEPISGQELLEVWAVGSRLPLQRRVVGAGESHTTATATVGARGEPGRCHGLGVDHGQRPCAPPAETLRRQL